MIWTNKYLEELTLEAEIEIAREVPCIINRVSLNVTAGTADYQLPDYISNIRRVFWKGLRLDPISQWEYDQWIYTLSQTKDGAFYDKAYSDAFFIGDRQISTPQSKPLRYFYNSFGENVILFHPNVHEDVEDTTDIVSLWGSGIKDRVVVEFYAVPDGIIDYIPVYVRRRTIKSYIMWKAFLREGSGQNLKAAEFHRIRFVIQLAKMRKIIENVYEAAIKTRSEICTEKMLPARPVLPWNWQTETVYED